MVDCSDRFLMTSKDLKIVLERVMYYVLIVVKSGVIDLEDLRLVILIVWQMSSMWHMGIPFTHHKDVREAQLWTLEGEDVGSSETILSSPLKMEMDMI